PTTAAVDPGSITASACVTDAPRPATLTQLQTIPSATASAFVNTGTTHSSNVTITSANPPMWEFSKTGVPSAMSAMGTRSSAPSDDGRRLGGERGYRWRREQRGSG